MKVHCGLGVGGYFVYMEVRFKQFPDHLSARAGSTYRAEGYCIQPDMFLYCPENVLYCCNRPASGFRVETAYQLFVFRNKDRFGAGRTDVDSHNSSDGLRP